MFAARVRLLLHIILSPRRLLIAALLATFFYSAVVTTKARLFPQPGPTAGRGARASEQVHPVSGRSSGRRAAGDREAHSE